MVSEDPHVTEAVLLFARAHGLGARAFTAACRVTTEPLSTWTFMEYVTDVDGCESNPGFGIFSVTGKAYTYELLVAVMVQVILVAAGGTLLATTVPLIVYSRSKVYF